MLLIINMNNPTMNISKYMIDKKIMQKKNFKNVKWNFRDKNLQQSHHLKLLKIKKYILRKFQCISLINSSFNEALFFTFHFKYLLLSIGLYILFTM
jgi:hypothetical protein